MRMMTVEIDLIKITIIIFVSYMIVNRTKNIYNYCIP